MHHQRQKTNTQPIRNDSECRRRETATATVRWAGRGKHGAGGITVFACARLTCAVLSGVLSFLISSKGNSNRGGVRSVRAVPGRVGCVGCVGVWGAKMIAKLNFQFYFSNEKFKSNSRSPLSLSPSPRPLRAADKIFIAYKLLLRFVFICSTSFQLEVCKSRVS